MTEDSRGTGARSARAADVVSRGTGVDPDVSAQFLDDDPPTTQPVDRGAGDRNVPYDQDADPGPAGRTPSTLVGATEAEGPDAAAPPRRPILPDRTVPTRTDAADGPEREAARPVPARATTGDAVAAHPGDGGGGSVVRHSRGGGDDRGPGFLTRVVAIGLAVLIGLTGGVIALTWMLGRTVSGLNPFDETTIDRSGPPVLKSLTDLQRFQAAEGYYEVVIDQETDVANLPSFLAGERTIFVAAGSVDAVVDFSKLADGNVTANEDRTSITVALPAVEVGEPQLDLDRSYVANQQRGLRERLQDALGRTGGSTNTEALYRLAQQRIQQEAGRTDELRTRAEANTRAMLTSLLQQAGYTSVTVTFAPAD